MNVVYKLTNISKTKGPRFYIGSKKNCQVKENTDGTKLIYTLRGNNLYLGSSTSEDFARDLKDKHIFETTILEEVDDKDNILEVEYKYLVSLDVANNPDYYNRCNGVPATTNYSKLAKNEVVNKYGELASSYNGSQQMLNRRDNTARGLGYSSFYSLAAYIHIQFKLGKSGPEVAQELGKADRHFPAKFIILWDMDKCLEEVQDITTEMIEKIRHMYVNETVSVTKLSEILNLEVPTIRYALSDIGQSQAHSTLYRRLLLSEEELLDEIEEKLGTGSTVRDIVLEKGSSTKPILKYTEKAFRRLYKKYYELQASR